MSKIDEMIKELCPDGVERIPFLECATFTRGITYNKSQEANQGQDSYKVLRANNITLGLNCLNFDDVKEVVKDVKVKPEQWLKKDDILICAGSGSKEHVGKVAYINRDIDYCFGGFMGVIRPKDCVSSRYLFHCLVGNTFSEYLESALNSTTINNLNNQVMSGYKIPLPPLSIQQKIVSVLDSFTTLIDKMKQEVEKRKKQMEYYREKLLTFKDGECEWKTLGEISIKHCSGSTPNKGIKEFYENGNIPWLRTQDVKFNEITEIDSFITEEAVKRTSVKWIPENCVIVAISGATAGRCAINKIKTTTNQHCLNIEINGEVAQYKYVFYCVMFNYDTLILMKQGARGDLNSSAILRLKIPVPSLNKQSSIVSTLDKFESYITKLEKLIVLRQKQYEYYREQLLTFE